jgi:hypothetical protein
MTIKNKYEIGEEVILKTDQEGLKRIITGINIKPGNSLIYEVQLSEFTSFHYEFELESYQL